jgi:hypothetical protein
MTLKNNGPNEPCSQTNNAPGERSPQITMTGPADPKEQRSWLELSPQITMIGPPDPKERRSWLELSPQITMIGPADPKEQPLTN